MKRRFPPDVHLRGGATTAIVSAEQARQFYAPIIPIVVELRNQGYSLRAIAAVLDERGVKLRFEIPGSRWSATQVRRVLQRAAAAGVTAAANDQPEQVALDNHAPTKSDLPASGTTTAEVKTVCVMVEAT